MSLTPLPARIDYLTDAAHLLRGAAPEISAHLMSERADLLSNQDTAQGDLQRQHVCAACGHIMILGQGADMKLERREIPRRGKGVSGKAKPAAAVTASSGPTKVFSCNHCGSITRICLPPPAPAIRRKVTAKTMQPKKATTSATPSEASKPTANASSKKRAKNRKAGLQALLSGQQKQSPSLLTLGDFMKK